jgi:excisionase family DNA binding protein
MDKLLSPAEVSELLGAAVQTLARWRSEDRDGPPFVKVGRLVRYRRADLERWAAERTRTRVR